VNSKSLIQKFIDLRRPMTVAVLILLVFFFCDFLGVFTIPRLKSKDFFVKLKYKFSPKPKNFNTLTIVEINDTEYKKYSSKWPWDRNVFADLIYRLDEMKPSVIGLALGFMGESTTSPESDFFLAEALADSGSVILASYFDDSGKYVIPCEMFNKAIAGFGFTNKPVDKDNIVRDTKCFERYIMTKDIIDYSFDLKVASLFLGLKAEEFNKSLCEISGSIGIIPINYSARLSDFNTISFSDVIDGHADMGLLNKKIVLVGTTASVFHDFFGTPLGEMPSIGITANTVLMYLNKSFVYVLPRIYDVFFIIIAALFISLGISRTKGLKIFFLIISVLVVFFIASVFLILNNIFWDFFGIPFVVLLISLTSGLSHYIKLFVQSLRVHKLATTDTLTGLFTRRYLIFKLENELKMPLQERRLALVLFKIENFESIVNEVGLEKANSVVKEMGQLLISTSRKTRGIDFLARYGESEFCSLLHNTQGKGGLSYAERVMKVINNKIFSVSSIVIRIGVVDRKDIPRQSAKIFVKCAEAALLRGQAGEGERIVLFDSHVDHIAFEDYIKGEEITEADLSYVAEELDEKNRELSILINNVRSLKQDVVASERLSVTGKLAAIIHHDLNKPIVNLKRGFKILLDDLFNDTTPEKLSSAKKFMESALKEIERLENLTWQLKDLYRPIQKEIMDTSINSLLEEMLHLSFAQITEKKLSLVKNMDDRQPIVSANTGDLKQAFLNLIMNAIEAMPKGGELGIKTLLLDNMVEIDIKDTGCGIPPENMEKLFKAFFSTKTAEKGSGLGLYASMEIIKKYGGNIKVESEVNKGTTFKVFLPVKSRS
jgi:diguanylate cyclase (GGDEF)-like protein